MDSRLPYVLDFLDALSRDRWYTRAWVVQEAISARKRLGLVFRRALSLAYPSSLRTGSKLDTDGLPHHSLDTAQRVFPSGVVCVPVQDFEWLVRRARLLLGRTSFIPLGSQLVRASSLRRPADQIVAATVAPHPTKAKTRVLLDPNVWRQRVLYSSQWEMIPHPSLQSMGICWVATTAAETDDEEDDVGRASDAVESAKREKRQEQVGMQGTLKVIGKAKGMWQIMEMPSQSHEFA